MPVYTDVTVPKLLQFTALSSKPFHCCFFLQSLSLPVFLHGWNCCSIWGKGQKVILLYILLFSSSHFIFIWCGVDASGSIACMLASLISTLVNSPYTMLGWHFIQHKHEFSDSYANHMINAFLIEVTVIFWSILPNGRWGVFMPAGSPAVCNQFFHPLGVKAQVALHFIRFCSHSLHADSMLFVINLATAVLCAGGRDTIMDGESALEVAWLHIS